MKKIYFLFLLAFLPAARMHAQNIGISSMAAPVSGCNLSCTDSVVIYIQNGAVPIGAPFTAKYSVNGVLVASEVISTFLAGSATYTYTFFTLPVLCTPGTYHIFLEVDLPGDTFSANDTLSMTIVNDANVVPGVFTGNDTVCVSGNSGTVQLTGYTGYLGQWEYSVTSGAPWIPMTETGDSHTYSNLDTTTVFHVLIDGGYCPDGVSSWAVIHVDDTSNAGFTVSSVGTVCASGNTGMVNVTSYNGQILGWESSTDGGGSFLPIANTTSTENFTNLTQTTLYQAIVQNGVCAPDTSAPVTIAVDLPGVGGAVQADTSVCFGETGNLSLTGSSGTIFCWLSSTNGGATWTPISNNTTTQTYTGTSSVTYTAVIQNGVCPPDTATMATVTVLPLPIIFAGVDDTILVGETLCFNATGGLVYEWTPTAFLNDPNIANPCMTAVIPGVFIYTVGAENADGCRNSDLVIITVMDTLAPEPIDSTPSIVDLVVCNFVTPNDDGDNDVWNIIGIEQYPDNSVMVINNHGQIVFEQSTYKNTWTGGELPDGSYFYVVKVAALDKTFKGVLTLTSSR